MQGLATRRRSTVRWSSIFWVLLIAAVAAAYPERVAWAAACIPGHNTVVTPCTFDNGALSLASTSAADLSTGGGHHTIVSFPGSAIEIAADTGFPPYSASMDGTNGVASQSITITVSTVSGLPLIDDVSLTLIDPVITGTGSITFSVDGDMATFPTTSSIDLLFPIDVNSTTDTFSITLAEGTGGNASVEGVIIGFSTVPEPGSLVLFGTALAGFGLMRRRRKAA